MSVIVDLVHKAVDLVVDTVKAVIEDPLPTLLMIAGASVGIPVPLTAAAVTAARGGDLEDVAKAAAFAYAGEVVTPAISKAISPTVSSAVTNPTVAKALTNAISEGLVSGTTAAVDGRDFGEGFAGGFAGSAVASGTQTIIAPSVIAKTEELGFSKQTGRAISTAISSAAGAGTETAVGGGDFSTAFARSLTTAGIDYAAMSAAEGVKEYTNKKIASNDEELKAAYEKTVSTNKAVIENSAAQQKLINEANARAIATNEKGEALQAEIDAFNNNPKRTQAEKDALQAKVDAFNVEHAESNDFVAQKNKELDALVEQQKTLFKDYETSVNEAEKLASNFDETEAANAAKVKEVFDVNQEYKTLTGEDLTAEKLSELEKSGNLRDAVAKDLGYESTDAMQTALTMKSLPTDVAPKLEAREGETAGPITKEVLEDGSVVYERQFSGTAPDGTPYVYKATYDALNPSGVRYDMIEGVAISGGDSSIFGDKTLPAANVISGTERPNFGVPQPEPTVPNTGTPKTPQDYLDDLTKARNNYITASVKASTAATPENVAAANQAKMEAEIAQKIATDNGVVVPPVDSAPVTELQPLPVDQEPVKSNQALPVSETVGVNETVAPPTLVGDLLGGLAGTVVKGALTPDNTTGGVKTVGTTVAKAPTTTAATTSGLSSSTRSTPSAFFEAPNIMLTPQQIAERESFILGRQVKRGGLISKRKK